MKRKGPRRPPINNLVAKHAHKVVRAAVHKSVKDYRRKPKHPKKPEVE